MHVGIHANRFTWPGGPAAIGPTLAAIAQRAEAAGLYNLSVMDHFFQIAGNGPPNHEMLEGYTTLGFVAGKTSRLRLGTVVTGVTYRHPGLLIKEATTLDVLSGGRAFLGIGAAWFEGEHLGLGVPFPPLKERFERLEEALQIAHHMWKGDETPFVGRYYQLQQPLCYPRPVQQPHPPILIGGGGEQKTLRLVATYGDACNLHEGVGPEVLRHKLEVLGEHCVKAGRPYDQITKSANARLLLTRDGRDGSSTPAQTVDRLAALRELGFTWVNFSMPNANDPAVFDLLGSEVVSRVAGL
jgi:F420-dependent oxidoreductase-like protein